MTNLCVSQRELEYLNWRDQEIKNMYHFTIEENLYCHVEQVKMRVWHLRDTSLCILCTSMGILKLVFVKNCHFLIRQREKLGEGKEDQIFSYWKLFSYAAISYSSQWVIIWYSLLKTKPFIHLSWCHYDISFKAFFRVDHVSHKHFQECFGKRRGKSKGIVKKEKLFDRGKCF